MFPISSTMREFTIQHAKEKTAIKRLSRIPLGTNVRVVERLSQLINLHT